MNYLTLRIANRYSNDVCSKLLKSGDDSLHHRMLASLSRIWQTPDVLKMVSKTPSFVRDIVLQCVHFETEERPMFPKIVQELYRFDSGDTSGMSDPQHSDMCGPGNSTGRSPALKTRKPAVTYAAELELKTFDTELPESAPSHDNGALSSTGTDLNNQSAQKYKSQRGSGTSNLANELGDQTLWNSIRQKCLLAFPDSSMEKQFLCQICAV